jgi:tetratricopeptide (TPR) repeat protein
VRAFAYFNFEQTEQQLASAKAAIDTAVRLGPNDPAVIEGLGDYYYYGCRDYIRATEQYMRLAQIRPNDPNVYFSLGLLQRRQGRWADAISNLRRALKLDPTNEKCAFHLIVSLAMVHRFDEMEAVIRKAVAEHPQSMLLQDWLGAGPFLQRGSTVEMKAFAHREVEPSEHEEHVADQKDNAFFIGRLEQVYPARSRTTLFRHRVLFALATGCEGSRGLR